MLIVFDRVFGTFVAERPGVAIRYGLVEPIRSNNPIYKLDLKGDDKLSGP